MGALLNLVQRGGDWAGPQPAQALLAVGPYQRPAYQLHIIRCGTIVTRAH